MARLSIRICRLLLLGLILTPLLHMSGPSVVSAQDGDIVEGEDEEEMEVMDEEEEGQEEETVTVPDSEEEGDDEEDEGGVVEGENEEEEEEVIGPHPDADTVLIFTNRQNNEFIAGEVVDTLIGFTNKWKNEFIVTGIEASFRYPQDFGYHIQNFSMVYYDTYVMPQTQVSFVYNFVPSESFYARPFGLQLNVYYKDIEGTFYKNAVFNDTVNIVEYEEGYDGETFFMYVFMVSGISLLMFIVHYVYTTVRRGGRSAKKPIETGTQGKDDIDYQWLPEGTIPKKSPRPSPRKTRSTNKK